jgi:hypothetical protein
MGHKLFFYFNRGNNGSEPITVQWIDIGFPQDRSALVRNLWAKQDLGIFTSPNIDYHSSMMLKMTPTK